MGKILIIGASGFVGRHLTRALIAAGQSVRCMVRTPAKVTDLAAAGAEIIQGDMSDSAAVLRAADGVEAAYVAVHTLSSQPNGGSEQGFMDIETAGLNNIVEACHAHGARRLIYLTSMGTDPASPSVWLRERGKAEQALLNSGLDVTVIQPGQIVGVGGTGFDAMLSQAKSRVAVMIGRGNQRWRNIAVDDLVYYLVGVLDQPKTFGRRYDVGCDDILTGDQMVDLTAEVLGRRPPLKLHIPRPVLTAMAPLIERIAKVPKGALSGLIESMKEDATGDPMPIRQILPRQPLTYREAVERALAQP